MYAQDSIELLKLSGINFAETEARGINVHSFGELLMSSGIVLNEEVRMIRVAPQLAIVCSRAQTDDAFACESNSCNMHVHGWWDAVEPDTPHARLNLLQNRCAERPQGPSTKSPRTAKSHNCFKRAD
jgi:hypothetical protein